MKYRIEVMLSNGDRIKGDPAEILPENFNETKDAIAEAISSGSTVGISFSDGRCRIINSTYIISVTLAPVVE